MLDKKRNLLPVITSENDVYPYLKKISQFPLLTNEEEKDLAYRWVKNGDTKAAQKLVTSHLRLVAKIAMGYKGYGLPIFDLISEGNLGLMQAVKKFDPDKGFRLATYAIWWIRASVQEYVLHSWSLVKIGTTAAQKKLFFNLRRMRNQLKKYEEGHLSNDQIKSISVDLGVTVDEVKQMEGRVFNQDFPLIPLSTMKIKVNGSIKLKMKIWILEIKPKKTMSLINAKSFLTLLLRLLNLESWKSWKLEGLKSQ